MRLCPAHPGNPRTRIEGESPPQGKGHTVYDYSQLPAEKAAALVRWAGHLMAVVEERESNIATLRRG
jgi:hypothetical protein